MWRAATEPSLACSESCALLSPTMSMIPASGDIADRLQWLHTMSVAILARRKCWWFLVLLRRCLPECVPSIFRCAEGNEHSSAGCFGSGFARRRQPGQLIDTLGGTVITSSLASQLDVLISRLLQGLSVGDCYNHTRTRGIRHHSQRSLLVGREASRRTLHHNADMWACRKNNDHSRIARSAEICAVLH